MKIYVASSWRNDIYPEVVTRLRAEGHDVYDFRNTESSFRWNQIDSNWENWTAYDYREALSHPLAREGFWRDYNAMQEADAFILVLPSGRSAHLEAGWATGQ